MKTNHFIDKVKSFPFVQAVGYANDGELLIIYGKGPAFGPMVEEIAAVSTVERFKFDSNFIGFEDLDPMDQAKLYNTLDMYARTPIDERKEEKRFYYRVPITEFDGRLVKADEDHNYINHNVLTDNLILADSESMPRFKTKFTDSEIEQMDEGKQAIFKAAIKEPVE